MLEQRISRGSQILCSFEGVLKFAKGFEEEINDLVDMSHD